MNTIEDKLFTLKVIEKAESSIAQLNELDFKLMEFKRRHIASDELIELIKATLDGIHLDVKCFKERISKSLQYDIEQDKLKELKQLKEEE